MARGGTRMVRALKQKPRTVFGSGRNHLVAKTIFGRFGREVEVTLMPAVRHLSRPC